MRKYIETRRILERVNPTFWLFIIGFILFLIGASFPALHLLKIVGGFVVLVYFVLAIVWLLFHINH